MFQTQGISTLRFRRSPPVQRFPRFYSKRVQIVTLSHVKQKYYVYLLNRMLNVTIFTLSMRILGPNGQRQIVTLKFLVFGAHVRSSCCILEQSRAHSHLFSYVFQAVLQALRAPSPTVVLASVARFRLRGKQLSSYGMVCVYGGPPSAQSTF